MVRVISTLSAMVSLRQRKSTSCQRRAAISSRRAPVSSKARRYTLAVRLLSCSVPAHQPAICAPSRASVRRVFGGRFSKIAGALPASRSVRLRYSGRAAHQRRNPRNIIRARAAWCLPVSASRSNQLFNVSSFTPASGSANSGYSGPGLVSPCPRFFFSPPGTAIASRSARYRGFQASLRLGFPFSKYSGHRSPTVRAAALSASTLAAAAACFSAWAAKASRLRSRGSLPSSIRR